MVTGEIVQIMPAAIATGRPLTIYVSFNAYNPGAFGTVGTHAELRATLDSISGVETFYSISDKLQRTSEVLGLKGVMPARPVSGSIALRVREYTTPFTYKWVTVDSKSFTIGLPETITPVTPLPPTPKPDPLVVTPVVDEKEWYEFWKPDPAVVSPVAPGTPGVDVPFLVGGEEAKDKTVWIGLGLVAVAVVGLLVFRR